MVVKLDLLEDIEEERKIPEFFVAKSAPIEFKESQTEIAQAESRFRRREIKLDEDTKTMLANDLRQIIQGWREDRSALQQKLRERNDLYEGVVSETDFPWIGASQVHIPVPKIKMREIKSAIDRATMRPVPFLHTSYAGPDALAEDSLEFVTDLENFVEDKLKNATNVHKTLMDSIVPIGRDGTVPVQIIWDTEWETVFDYKTYENPDDFRTDYPSNKEAGVSEKRYNEIIDQLSFGQPYEVQYEYDVATYDGPRAFIVPLIDFVHWPVYEPEIDATRCHGKRVWFSELMVQQFFNWGKFTDKAQVEALLAGSGDEHSDQDLTFVRDQIEGISRQKNKKDAKEFELFELMWKGALTQQDKERNVVRKYLVWYREKNGEVYRVEPYPIRKGRSTYFPLRFVKRDNRLLGMSFMDDVADLSLEIDVVHRQRINSRTITHVPSFKAREAAKGRFDPGDRRFRFRPGMVAWLRDVDDVKQFDIRPVDLSGSVDEELMMVGYIDQVLGTIGQSGQANPVDPRAPARKEMQQLRQSTSRLDDYVAELLPMFSKIGQHVLDLYYQFGPNRIKFFTDEKDGKKIETQIERTKLFNPNVMFRVNGTSVFASPELEFQRMSEVYAIIANDPISAQDPRIRRNALGRLLQTSRVQDSKSFLPPLPQKGEQEGTIPTENEKRAAEKLKQQEQKGSARLAEQKLKDQGSIDRELVKGGVQAALEVPEVAGAGTNGNQIPGGI